MARTPLEQRWPRTYGPASGRAARMAAGTEGAGMGGAMVDRTTGEVTDHTTTAPPGHYSSSPAGSGETIEPMHVPEIPGSDPRYSPPRDGKDISLISKMADAASEMVDAARNGFNEDQGFAYATAEDIKRVVRGPLLKRRVMMLIGEVGRQTRTVPKANGSGVNRFVDLLVRFTFMDGDSGEIYSFHLVGSGTDASGKGNSIALTNAVKAALTNQFLIPLEDQDAAPASAAQPARDGSRARAASGGREWRVRFGNDKGKTLAELDTNGLLWLMRQPCRKPEYQKLHDKDQERYAAEAQRRGWEPAQGGGWNVPRDQMPTPAAEPPAADKAAS